MLPSFSFGLRKVERSREMMHLDWRSAILVVLDIAVQVAGMACSTGAGHSHASGTLITTYPDWLSTSNFYHTAIFRSTSLFQYESFVVSGVCHGVSFTYNAPLASSVGTGATSTYTYSCTSTTFTQTTVITYGSCFRLSHQFDVSDSSSSVSNIVTITALSDLHDVRYARYVIPTGSTTNYRGVEQGTSWRCSSKKCVAAVFSGGQYLGFVSKSGTGVTTNTAVVDTIDTHIIMGGSHVGSGAHKLAIGSQFCSIANSASVTFAFDLVQAVSIADFVSMASYPTDGEEFGSHRVLPCAHSATPILSDTSSSSLSGTVTSHTPPQLESPTISSSASSSAALASASSTQSSLKSLTMSASYSGSEVTWSRRLTTTASPTPSVSATVTLSNNISTDTDSCSAGSVTASMSDVASVSLSRNSSRSLTLTRAGSATFTASPSASSSKSNSATSQSLSVPRSISQSLTTSLSPNITATWSPRPTPSGSSSNSLSRSLTPTSSVIADTNTLASPSCSTATLSSEETVSLSVSPSTTGTSSPSATVTPVITTTSSGPVTESSSQSVSSSGCDDVPWSVSTLDEYARANASDGTGRKVIVSYDWFSANQTAPLGVVFASLAPWRLHGARLALGSERLVVEVTNVDPPQGGNTTAWLSALQNSSFTSAGGFVWPGVRKTPHVDQEVVVELDLKCSAVLAAGASFTILVRGLPPPTISGASKAVVGGSQAVSAVSGSPASASTMARVSSAMSLASCSQAIDSSTVAQSTDKAKALLPIQFYNSSSPNDDIVNSLLANYVFISVFAAVVVMVAAAISAIAHIPLSEVLLHLRWPSVLFPGLVATLPSAVGTVGAFLARATTSSLLPEDWVPCLIVCVMACVLWLGFCVWVTVVCVRGSGMLLPREKEVIVTFVDKLKRCDRSWFRDFLRVIFRSLWTWAPAAASSDQVLECANSTESVFSTFIQKYSSVFTELRVTWFTALDVWVTLLSSVVNAIPLTTDTGCIAVAATNVLLSLVLFVVAAVVRPFGSRFGTVQLLLLQLGALMCTCCVLAYILAPDMVLLTIVSYLVAVIAVIAMCRTVVDLIELINVAVKLRQLVKHRAASPSNAIPAPHTVVMVSDETVVDLPLSTVSSSSGESILDFRDDEVDEDRTFDDINSRFWSANAPRITDNAVKRVQRKSSFIERYLAKESDDVEIENILQLAPVADTSPQASVKNGRAFLEDDDVDL